MRFVILSSSRGTTMEAVLERIADGTLTAQCIGLITDKPDRGCVQKAEKFGLPYLIIERKKAEAREEYDRRIDTAIHDLENRETGNGRRGNLIITALGWMFLFSNEFVHKWRHKIINVHPSLLPLYPGAQGLADAMKDGVTETGMTIHLIDEGVDTGPILLQKKCPILPDDTLETLKEREQALEKEWYPRVLQMIETGELKLPK
jgi:phosphoribosylglycinamide formyltransferase 1